MLRSIAVCFLLTCTGVQAQDRDSTEWTVSELIGLIVPSRHPDFVPIPEVWCAKDGLYLRKAAAIAFVQMAEAAAADGVQLRVVSATRNFSYQHGIWSRKWQRSNYSGWSEIDIARDILKYSAMPGTSRHHWGTDLDLNNLENAYFEAGEGAVVAAWLMEHAQLFGFHQVYSADPIRPGYLLERWHWSYMPLAGSMLNAYNVCVDLQTLHSLEVEGMQWADSLRILPDFVNGIDRP